MTSDPIIDEIRRIRHAISAEYGHDPQRMLDYFADIQESLKDRLVNYGANDSAPRGALQPGRPERDVSDQPLVG